MDSDPITIGAIAGAALAVAQVALRLVERLLPSHRREREEAAQDRSRLSQSYSSLQGAIERLGGLVQELVAAQRPTEEGGPLTRALRPMEERIKDMERETAWCRRTCRAVQDELESQRGKAAGG